jgi:hypothetical protein
MRDAGGATASLRSGVASRDYMWSEPTFKAGPPNAVVKIRMTTPLYKQRHRRAMRCLHNHAALASTVAARLEDAGYLVLRAERARLSSRWGHADLIAIGHGRCLFVLIGQTRSCLTRRQHFAENIRRAGAELVILTDPAGVERFKSPARRAAETAATITAGRLRSDVAERTDRLGPGQADSVDTPTPPPSLVTRPLNTVRHLFGLPSRPAPDEKGRAAPEQPAPGTRIACRRPS